MFKRNVLTSAIVLAGGIWGSTALANTEAGAKFSSAAGITKASELMGKDVQDREGNEVGEISDFAINLNDSSITYAVVGLSGMFNTDAIAVPVTALSTSTEDDSLTLQVSQSEWKSAQTFSGSDWPLTASLATETGGAVASTDTDASSDQASDTRWQESADQYDQGSETVSSFDRDVEFDALDSDGDGYLSTEEFQAAKGTSTTDGTDVDEDGRISRSEFAAFETDERGSMTKKESSTDDRFGESDADHSYDSQDSDDVESDDHPE